MKTARREFAGNPVPQLQLVQAHAGRVIYAVRQWTNHSLPYWVLDVMTQGSQRQRVGSGDGEGVGGEDGGGAFTRLSGVLALYAPHTLYRELQEPGLRIEEAYMVFQAQGAINTQLRTMLSSAGVCHIQDPAGLATTPLLQLGQRYPDPSPDTDWLRAGLMLEILGLLFHAPVIAPGLRTLAPQTDSQGTLLDRINQFLKTHLHTPVSVADLAQAVGMSDSALAHTYPRLTGKTPYEAIQESKMTEAKRLLLRHGLNVQQVADRLGYSSAFNFSRTFKRIEGCAPSHYVARFAG